MIANLKNSTRFKYSIRNITFISYRNSKFETRFYSREDGHNILANCSIKDVLRNKVNFRQTNYIPIDCYSLYGIFGNIEILNDSKYNLESIVENITKEEMYIISFPEKRYSIYDITDLEDIMDLTMISHSLEN